jgi:hypothetical protein
VGCPQTCIFWDKLLSEYSVVISKVFSVFESSPETRVACGSVSEAAYHDVLPAGLWKTSDIRTDHDFFHSSRLAIKRRIRSPCILPSEIDLLYTAILTGHRLCYRLLIIVVSQTRISRHPTVSYIIANQTSFLLSS